MQISRKLFRTAVMALFLPITAMAATPLPPPTVCIGDTVCTSSPDPDPTNGSGAVRWQPGHYLRFGISESEASVLQGLDSIRDEPAVVGIKIYRLWRKIETSEGVYDWSFLDSVVARAASHGKYVIVRLQDRAFGTTDPAQAVPSYLSSYRLTWSRTTPSPAAGAALWRSQAMDHNIRVLKAIAKRYGDNPYFLGLSGAESVYGPNIGGDFSGQGVVNQEIRRMHEIRAYAPQLLWSWGTSWINDDGASRSLMQQFFAAAREDQGVILNGGPDALVDGSGSSGTSDGYDVTIGRIGGIDHRGKYFIGGNTDIDDWLRGATPSTVHNKLVGTGGARIMIWLRNETTGNSQQRWSTGILPFIRNHPITDMRCPAAISGGCITR